MSELERNEVKLPGTFQRQIERHFAVMLTAEIQRCDLKRPFDRAEVRHDHLPVANDAVEHLITHRRIGRRIFEHTLPSDARVFRARARKQFAPLSGTFRMRDVDAFGIDGKRSRAQSRNRRENTCAGAVGLQQKVLTFLCCHVV